MAITRVTTGRYKGQYQIRVQPLDKRTNKRVSLPVCYAATKREAKIRESELWAQYRQNQDGEVGNQRLTECFQHYIEREFAQGRWVGETYRSWQATSTALTRYLPRIKMRQVTEADIRGFVRQYVSERNVTVSRDGVISRFLAHLRCFFAHYGYLYHENPVPKRALERFFRLDEMIVTQQRYLLNDAERHRLITVLRSTIDLANIRESVSKLAIYVDLLTGMRPQELQALRWQNLQLRPEGYVFVINDAWTEHDFQFNGHLKGQRPGVSRETLPLTPELVQLLRCYYAAQRRYLAESGVKNKYNLIFLNLMDYRKCALGWPVTQAAINKMLRRLGKQAGIDPGEQRWSLYSLRHTVATKLANTPGISYPWAAARMGHRLEEFMNTYVHEDRDSRLAMFQLWTKEERTDSAQSLHTHTENVHSLASYQR